MSTEGYTAGTIFLEVTPVFGDAMNEIQRKAKGWNKALGDEMEKGGAEAGDRTAKVLGDKIEGGAKEAGKNASRVLGDEMEKGAKSNLGKFEREFKAAMQRAASHIGDSADAELRALGAQMKALGDVKIGVDMNAKAALAKMEELKIKATQIAALHPEVNVSTNAGAAVDELLVYKKLVTSLDGNTIKNKVKVDGVLKAVAELGLLGRMMSKVRGNSRNVTAAAADGGNAFRAFNVIILAAVTLLPALIPILAAVAGGLLALGPAMAGIGAGMGVMALGFSGITAAVKAMGDVQKNSAKDAEAYSKKMRGASQAVADAERNLARARKSAAQASQDAARSVADAQRSAAQASQDAARAVADAERSAAQAIEAALQRRRDAERSLRDAQKDAAQAQRDLTKARIEGQKELDDLNDRVKGNALDERQAVLDLFDATATYNAVMADAGSTTNEKEQASINLGEAKLRLKDIRDAEKDLAADKKKADKQGVDGTDAVQSAQDALTAALQRQRDAQRAVGDAAAEVTQARIDGARAVQDALRSQRRTEDSNARAIQDALRSQRQTEESNAQAIGDAQRSLTRQQVDYQDALTETGDIGSSSMQALEDAMGKLSPAGRRFARFIFGLRKGFYELRAVAQEGMLPGVQKGMETVLGNYGPRFTKFVGSMAKSIGGLFRQFGKMLTNPLWEDFFGMMAELGPKFMRQGGRILMDWMSIFAKLLTLAAPYSERFMKALVRISDRALAWMDSAKGTKAWTVFLDYAAKVGPKVADFFVNLWNAAKDLVKALAPFGEIVLASVGGLLKLIANMDPKLLQAFAIGIITLVVAYQVLNGVLTLMIGGMALWGKIMAGGAMGWTLGVIGVLILLAGAFVIAYTQCEGFRKVVDKVVAWLGQAFAWLWNKVLKPTFEWLGDALTIVGRAMVDFWQKYSWPTLQALGRAFKEMWRIVGPIIGWYIETWTKVGKVFLAVWRNFLWPVIDLLITAIAKILWKGVIKPLFNAIIDLWTELAAEFMFGYKHYIAPMFEWFGDKIGWVADKVGKAVGKIGDLWDSLRSKFSKPINAVIGFINKYLIGGFNKVAKFVGSDSMGLLPTIGGSGGRPPSAAGAGGSNAGQGNGHMGFASGGVLPGYTPGRDVHHYRGPSGDLHLSGGEAIMRPEWTAAMGRDYVYKANALASRLGVNGLKKMMADQKYGRSAFANGGVFWPVPGRLTGTYPGHDGVDINRGSGWDDYGDPIRAARAGRVSYVGYGRGYGQAIFIDTDNGYTNIYGHTSRDFVKAGQRVAGGQLIGEVGNTGNSSAPHLHFGVSPGMTFESALAFLNGAETGGLLGKVGGFFSGLAGWAKKALASPAKWLKNRVGDAFDTMGDDFGPFGEILGNLGEKLLGGMVDKLKGVFGGGGDSIASGPVQDMAKTFAASKYGWTGSQWTALKELVNRESGWNPNAQNPSSTAYGLFQFLDSTWGSFGPKTGDPKDQIRYGLEYIMGRYGSPEKALAFHDAHNWYADGGVYGEDGSTGPADNGTMMYDNGGYLPPGLTTVLNLTGKPEPVFTSEQFSQMQGSGGAATLHYEPHFEGSDLTAGDVADDFNFTVRQMTRGGKYAESR